ncbi:MAG TPA: YeeE/YedE family protein, partial [Kofleriaceae bacterium]
MASKWLLALLGGALIGSGSALLLLTHGQIAGISGIAGGLVRSATADRVWRFAFLAGLAVAGIVASAVVPGAIGAPVRPLAAMAVAGLL